MRFLRQEHLSFLSADALVTATAKRELSREALYRAAIRRLFDEYRREFGAAGCRALYDELRETARGRDAP